MERNDFFRAFINELDMSGIGDESRASAGDYLTPSLRRVGSEGRFAIYDMKAGIASFDTIVVSDVVDHVIALRYPSRVTHFEAEDMHDNITMLFDIAYPKQNHIPHVIINNGEQAQRLNLANYWEGKRYERALKQPLDSLIYFFESRVPAQMSSPLLNTKSDPIFMQGFYRGSSGAYHEVTNLSHMKANYMDIELAKELVARNRGFHGYDFDDAADELRGNLKELCKAHPRLEL